MTIQLQSARQSLRDFDLRALFIEELGWDNYKERGNSYASRMPPGT